MRLDRGSQWRRIAKVSQKPQSPKRAICRLPPVPIAIAMSKNEGDIMVMLCLGEGNNNILHGIVSDSNGYSCAAERGGGCAWFHRSYGQLFGGHIIRQLRITFAIILRKHEIKYLTFAKCAFLQMADIELKGDQSYST